MNLFIGLNQNKIMKIVHSCWSKPFCNHNSNSVIGGWNHPIYFYMSWALSCLSYKKFYNNIELVCDKHSKQILVDTLQLPYDSIVESLDDINAYHPDLWALGKLYAYNIQHDPFIHVDYDTYIWDRLPSSIESAELLSQHLEISYPHNNLFFDDVISNFDYIPQDIIKYRQHTKTINEVNAGIIGGNDINFFKKYVAEAFSFVDANQKHIDKLQYKGMFNTIFEQYLFYCMCVNNKRKVHFLFNQPIPSSFEGLADFYNIGRSAKFIHTVGYYKRSFEIGEQVSYRLFLEHPTYHKRIIDLYNSHIITNDFQK